MQYNSFLYFIFLATILDFSLFIPKEHKFCGAQYFNHLFNLIFLGGKL